MGVFGTGLYSGDFAMDLRSAVRAVSKLPFKPAKLVEILQQLEPDASGNAINEDHTIFWLVVADQFSKRGIVSDATGEKALEIIENGQDLAMLEKLGMSQRDLARRKKVLDELRGRLMTPARNESRKTLKSPQAYVMDVGDVLLYPTWKGDCVNPYMTRERQRITEPNDGWGAAVVIGRGRAFEFLAWYRLLTLVDSFAERPQLDQLRGELRWRLSRPGTCNGNHFKKLGFEKIGAMGIDEAKLRERLKDLRPGTSAAINDITIANSMQTTPKLHTRYLADSSGPLKGIHLTEVLWGIGNIESTK